MIGAMFRSARDREPVHVDYPWSAWVRALSRFRDVAGEDKTECPAWSPVRYREGMTRCTSAVEEIHALVLDYDDGMTVADALERWQGYERLAHTSWSTSEGKPKCRVVLPLAEPVAPAGWSDAYEWIRVVDGERADPKCKNPDRIYFLPAVGLGGPHSARARPGRLLDMRPIVERAHEARTRREAAERAERERTRQRSTYSPDAAEKEIRRRLATDPALRAEVGERLGGVVVSRAAGAVVQGVTCPSCGRPSVWWPVAPEKVVSAMCVHRNSCGWNQSIAELWRMR